MNETRKNAIQVNAEVINKKYIILSQTEGYKTNVFILKVFDIEEQIYKTLEVPKRYLR